MMGVTGGEPYRWFQHEDMSIAMIPLSILQNTCPDCGEGKERVDCYNCDNGFSYHDCGDDVCCCFLPEDNVNCDICLGEGEYLVCPTCHPDMLED